MPVDHERSTRRSEGRAGRSDAAGQCKKRRRRHRCVRSRDHPLCRGALGRRSGGPRSAPPAQGPERPPGVVHPASSRGPSMRNRPTPTATASGFRSSPSDSPRRRTTSSSPPFDDFHLTEDEWYELHIASWLHDCGKVTTPEYVVDKSTKLETLYDRIHEIRTRFEVLWRDAEIECLRKRAEGTPDDPEAQRRLEERFEKIRSDWEFIAECNQGEVFMIDERIARVEEIGQQTWLRHLDDRIGLSHDELERKKRAPESGLPVVEHLLADKIEHLIERPGDGPVFGDNPHGFDMDVPRTPLQPRRGLQPLRPTRDPDHRRTVQDQRPHHPDHQHARPSAVPARAPPGPRLGRQPPREARRHRLPAPARRRQALDPRADHGASPTSSRPSRPPIDPTCGPRP